MNTQTAFLFVRKQHTLHRILFKHICYIQAEGNYCYLRLIDKKKYATKISLRQLLLKLPEKQFIRIHKSYVVNLNYLERIDTKEREVLITNEALPVGRTFISGLIEQVIVL